MRLNPLTRIWNERVRAANQAASANHVTSEWIRLRRIERAARQAAYVLRETADRGDAPGQSEQVLRELEDALL